MLKAGGRAVFEQTVSIGPGQPFCTDVSVPAQTERTELEAVLTTSEGETLISYQPVRAPYDANLPETVKPPPAPKDIKTVEELYLTGLRVEQINSPRVDPFDYYEEALRLDPCDTRTNTMVGINYNRRGMYDKAEEHLRRAVTRLSAEYTRPGDTEALYHLGLALRAQGKLDEAYDAFYRATWDGAIRSAAYYQLAELSCRKGIFDTALDHVDRSLSTNALDSKARNLKAILLRRSGRPQEARDIVRDALQEDPLDFLAQNELYLIERKNRTLRDLEVAMRGDVQAYLELATDYMNMGLWDEAGDVLTRIDRKKAGAAGTYPLVYYYLGYLCQQRGNTEAAGESYSQARKMPADYCFPFRAESAEVLKAALARNPADARAYYYLGNLFYDLQPDKAIEYWERSRELDGIFALAHRNLGWAYHRTRNDVPRAIASYEKAVACNGDDPRLFAELDQLYELGNTAPEKRLAVLEEHHATVVKRNDSFEREITALVLAGRCDEAIRFLSESHFHVREGGGEIHDVYVDAHLLRGLSRLRQGQAKEALEDFRAAGEYPENLSVGRPKNDPRASQMAYYRARAYESLGDGERAKECYTQAADQKGRFRGSETRFCQAMSLKKLGRDTEAQTIFDELVRTGKERLSGAEAADFFAKFGERQTPQARQASAHFTIGLGYLGKGDIDAARSEFAEAAKLNVSHVWAKELMKETD